MYSLALCFHVFLQSSTKSSISNVSESVSANQLDVPTDPPPAYTTITPDPSQSVPVQGADKPADAEVPVIHVTEEVGEPESLTVKVHDDADSRMESATDADDSVSSGLPADTNMNSSENSQAVTVDTDVANVEAPGDTHDTQNIPEKMADAGQGEPHVTVIDDVVDPADDAKPETTVAPEPELVSDAGEAESQLVVINIDDANFVPHELAPSNDVVPPAGDAGNSGDGKVSMGSHSIDHMMSSHDVMLLSPTEFLL